MNKKILFICILVVAVITTVFALPKILSSKGKQCYKKGNYECAADCFKKAHMLAPTVLDYEYYYTKTLTKLKPSYKIQKEMFYLHKHAKSKSAKNLANNTINQWKSGLLMDLGNNYIEQTPSDADIVHWNKDSFPLKVYIEKNTHIPEYYDAAIKNALALWTNSVSFVSFRLTNNKKNAQIIIEIKQTPSNSCVNGICKYITGFTTPNRTGHQLKSMNIVLYDKNPSKEYFSQKEIYHTIAHELGHALGIMGHSYSSEDLMYSTQNNTPTIYDQYKINFPMLSSKDINTINLLYRLEPTITDKVSNNPSLIYAPIILGTKDDILDRKIKEAQNYIKTSPTLSAGYIDLSSAYLKKGNKKAAEEILLRGLNYAKSNDERFMIYYNLAIVSCVSRHFNKAQEYLNNAKQIKNTPELKEIEYLINNKIVPTI